MIDRTIYCGNVSAMIDEATIRQLFSHCGDIARVKIAGDATFNTRFVFVEFTQPHMAHTAVALNGLVLADRQMKISMAKSPITGPSHAMPNMAMPNMMGGYGMPNMMGSGNRPNANNPANEERKTRTVYIQGVDGALQETQLAQFFSVCGPILSARIAGNYGQSGRKGWVEFATVDAAYAANMLNGQQLGAHQIQVGPSQSVIQTNGLPPGWQPIPVEGVPPQGLQGLIQAPAPTYAASAYPMPTGPAIPASSDLDASLCTVKITAIPKGVEGKEICQLMTDKAGKVAKFQMEDAEGGETLVAHVEFTDIGDAQSAISASGAEVGGGKITIEQADKAIEGAAEPPALGATEG
eukprot:CAMPEP_0182880626 /NCGR_PEP_ID=MMETSP0034_2-20130328/16676_1 /TAXON_ID=156128 /ORGANISM="Nephroselmis pyriformis, Strain CCMP717" /LENGTH=351 /DNA_ID=CAMNT_0025013621 /DNA_START=98 /DNA_END=1150 /DNA_ORIENTATION=-